jgi:hypothetical protein
LRGPFILALVAWLGCSRGQPEVHTSVARTPPDAGQVKQALSGYGADITWLVGTWERQTGPKEWLLFNAPKEVGVISGKPPTLTSRGEFVPNGRSISLFFRGPGGNLERVLEASDDYSELREDGMPKVTYRRGAPP